eukprot:TRINITY_DN6837_c0_g1_i1.p2 TRINITY_DN6837_c0_g1~~TRINITY_DN6837_c0_g1_i1.p2  ORF type:complete len:420 (+),score=161.92 TRINITY_DN6837_c0_g1_i1:91-1350(+)
MAAAGELPQVAPRLARELRLVRGELRQTGRRWQELRRESADQGGSGDSSAEEEAEALSQLAAALAAREQELLSNPCAPFEQPRAVERARDVAAVSAAHREVVAARGALRAALGDQGAARRRELRQRLRGPLSRPVSAPPASGAADAAKQQQQQQQRQSSPLPPQQQLGDRPHSAPTRHFPVAMLRRMFCSEPPPPSPPPRSPGSPKRQCRTRRKKKKEHKRVYGASPRLLAPRRIPPPPDEARPRKLCTATQIKSGDRLFGKTRDKQQQRLKWLDRDAEFHVRGRRTKRLKMWEALDLALIADHASDGAIVGLTPSQFEVVRCYAFEDKARVQQLYYDKVQARKGFVAKLRKKWENPKPKCAQLSDEELDECTHRLFYGRKDLRAEVRRRAAEKWLWSPRFAALSEAERNEAASRLSGL